MASLLHLSLKPRYGPHLLRAADHIPGVGKEGLRSLFSFSAEEGEDFLEIVREASEGEGMNRQKKEGLQGLYHLLRYLSHLKSEPSLSAKVENALKLYQSLSQEKKIFSKGFAQILLSYCKEHEKRSQSSCLSEFLKVLALYEEERPKAHLMTAHAAKGLEFSKVFVMGVEEGLFPHLLAIKDGQIEEERRIFYVAMTRAKERLILSYCRYRCIYGEIKAMTLSRFLGEIPRAHVEDLQESAV